MFDNTLQAVRAVVMTLGLLTLTGGLPGAVQAASLRCTFSPSTIDFGTINILDGATHTATGSMDITCTGNPGQDVTICPNIGSGTGNPTAYDPRQLDKWGASTAKLNFNIYWPSGGNIWGSYHWPYPPRPPVLHLQLDATGSASTSMPMPAAIVPGQYWAIPGTYNSRFQNPDILYEFKDGIHPDCTAPTGQRTRRRFRVRVRVDRVCEVSATDMDFGTVGALSAPVDATATITVRCNNTVDYKIRIDGGQTGRLDPAAREMRNGTHAITYGIYRDAARTLGWGRRNDNDINATGTGYPQTFTAYGRVPAQPTPPPGVYTDTLIVSVVF